MCCGICLLILSYSGSGISNSGIHLLSKLPVWDTDHSSSSNSGMCLDGELYLPCMYAFAARSDDISQAANQP